MSSSTIVSPNNQLPAKLGPLLRPGSDVNHVFHVAIVTPRPRRTSVGTGASPQFSLGLCGSTLTVRPIAHPMAPPRRTPPREAQDVRTSP